MPIRQDGRTHCDHGRWRADADQDDDDGGHRDRRGRVHHNAEGAVVGVGIVGVDVRHLRNGQQGEQNQAHYRGSARCACPRASTAAGLCLQSTQK
jgi:hypothetical protein